jgi:hypothetical protein
VAEWKAYQIAAAGDIAALAESAAALADTVKETLTLANLGMEAVKLLAQLQNINPLLIALEALADEVLKEIANLKEAGYYYLMIDPYFIKNVTPEPAFTYGFEQLRNEGGELLWKAKINDSAGEWTGLYEEKPGASTHHADFPNAAQLESGEVQPALAVPRKLIPGGYNPYKNSTIDPLASISPYPKFSTAQVIEEFSKAFKDEGDVPRYESHDFAPKKAGTIVYDRAGAPVSGWDKSKDFGLQLYKDGLRDDGVTRTKINAVTQHGKPNIITGGSAIVIIIAAPSFDVFTDTFNAFSKMFSDIPEFTAVAKSMLDSFAEILTPNDIVLKLTQVDTNYGTFAEGDIIGGEKYGGLAEIVSVNADSVIATSMSTQKEVRMTDQLRNVIKYIETIDNNSNERWIDMEVTAKPIRGVDGLNSFIAGDDVYEMEKRGEGGAKTKEGTYEFSNYVTKGKHTVELPQVHRIYAKLGKVAMEKLAALPDSTPPDFSGIQIQHLIPAWGDFFQMLENFVKQLKGMISDSAAFIQDIIDMIKDIEKFLEDMVKLIEEFLEFFSITLPSTGVYALNVRSEGGGNDGLAAAIRSATGLPDLAYAAGILFVGTDERASDLLATILQLD